MVAAVFIAHTRDMNIRMTKKNASFAALLHMVRAVFTVQPSIIGTGMVRNVDGAAVPLSG